MGYEILLGQTRAKLESCEETLLRLKKEKLELIEALSWWLLPDYFEISEIESKYASHRALLERIKK